MHITQAAAAWLAAHGVTTLPVLDRGHLEARRRDVDANHPQLSPDEREALAIYTTLHHPDSPHNAEIIRSAPLAEKADATAGWLMNAQLRDAKLTREALREAARDAAGEISGRIFTTASVSAERLIAAAEALGGAVGTRLEIQDSVLAANHIEAVAEAKRGTKIALDIADVANAGRALLRTDLKTSIDITRNVLRSEIQISCERTNEILDGRLMQLSAETRNAATVAQEMRADARAEELRAEARAEHRSRRAAIAGWIQTALLLAIFAALLAGLARAQTTVAPVATPSTGNSALTSYITSAASTNATSVKASAGNVYTIRAINTTATLYYLRLYNLAAAPTCSSATGFVETIPVPASATGAGLVITQYPQAYTTGIAYCLTGGGSSTDNTNAATGVYVTVLYK